MSQFTPRRGVAWSKVGDVGVIINPWKERMIGLSAAAYDGWERLVSEKASPGGPFLGGPSLGEPSPGGLSPGEPSPGEPGAAAGSPQAPGPSGAMPEPGLLAFFRQMGLFEGDGGDPSPEAPELPPQVLWTEAFQPLAFTYSCATNPGQSYACDQAPTAGPRGNFKQRRK